MHIRNPFYVKVGLGFLVIGLVGLALPFVSFGLSEDYVLLQQVAEQKQADASLNDQFLKESSGTESTEIQPTPTARPDPNLVNIPDRLAIPRAGIDMPLFESTNPNVLLKGGWIFPDTSTPDKGHNTVIFGHRFRFLPPITNTFYSLDKVQIGDAFTVAWKGVVYVYKITDKKIIEPTDFSVLNQTSESEVTLITCAPLFSTKQRLVVVGTLIK